MHAIGLDGHTGRLFSTFTRGETLPFSFQILEEDEVTPINITGWRMYVAFNPVLNCADSPAPALEAVLLPQDAINGIFSGEISDDETFSLPAGAIYGEIRIVDNIGRAFVVDKAQLTVGGCINPRREQ